MNDAAILLGWREWVSLPNLGIPRIKAKIDTGARTSTLHAFKVNVFQENDKTKVCFLIHPKQRSEKRIVSCVADLCDKRWVTDSSGHREERYVIQTDLLMAGRQFTIEVTLTNRDDMRFRMLVGRTALKNFLVDPGASYLSGKIHL